AVVLNLTAGGNITQAVGASLGVTGHASITTGDFGINLSSASNNFNVVSLTNSGPNAVSLTTALGLVIDAWSLGSGPVTVKAGGAITETAGETGLVQRLRGHGGPSHGHHHHGNFSDNVAGAVSFSAGGNPILLDNVNNLLLGPVSFNTTGATGHVT